MPFLMAFRACLAVALLLGLANLLFGFAPRWAIDTHLLLGVLAVLSAWGFLWPLRSSRPAVGGMALGLLLLTLGLGLRFGWWGGLGVGLFHLAVALATATAVEMTAAGVRRAAARLS